MISDPNIREQGYIYFLSEAPELLQVIEQELLTLPEEYSIAKVHSLMRATHTLKGGAANVGLEVIKTVAHYMEDVVKALYNPEIVIDTELQTLLLQGYECLREPLLAELQGGTINEEQILDRASESFAKLQAKLGDFFGAQAQIPSSIELGFDIVQSVFEMGVKQRLEGITEEIKNSGDEEDSFTSLSNVLRSEAEVFVGLAESLNLPGFGAIATNTIAALDVHPDMILDIATIALADFQQAREEILAGDRTVGGTSSAALQQLAGNQDFSAVVPEVVLDPQNLESELEQFREFITSDRYNSKQPLKLKECKSYLKITRYCLGWFHQSENIPLENLTLTLLIPQVRQQDTANQEQEAKTAAIYVDDWVSSFLNSIKDELDSQSLCLYRHAAILKVVLAIAKFLSIDQTYNIEAYRDLPLVRILQRQLAEVVKEYKNYPPITDEEKKWLEHPQLQSFMIEQKLPATDSLVEEIWGTPVASESTSIQLSTPQSVVPLVQELEISNLTPSTLEIKAEKPLSAPHQSPITNPSVRVELEELARLNHLTGNMLINQNRQILQDEQLQEAVQNLRSNLKRHQQTLNKLRDWSNLMLTFPTYQTKAVMNVASVVGKGIQGILDNRQQTSFDSLELDEYTELSGLFHSALEETVQLGAATDVIDQIAKQLSYTLERQQSLLSHVRNDLTAVQMLPLGQVLGRFPRMIQQLATSNKKPVELKISGDQILVDKAIAQQLYDPLLHLVRNSFDHGIESPEIRHQRGKQQQGLIEIRAYYQGNQTIIEVKDDGQGLDFEAIRRRAVEQNFVSPEQVNQLSKAQLLDLLFQPGFSTKSTVNDLSGRGIGLDVVRNQLNNLKGSITVKSQPQMGTIFSLQIPFSLTSAKFFVCQAGGTNYALLSETIAKIVLPKPEQIQVFEGKKVLMYSQGTDQETSVVPVHKLSELIKYTSVSLLAKNSQQEVQKKTDNSQLLLLQGTRGFLGLEVDQIIGEQELAIRPLGSAIAAPNYIFGSSILGDGRLILAIDGAVLLEQGISSSKQPTADINLPMLPASTVPALAAKTPIRELPPAINVTSKTVLVVDDSISYRQTVALNLQKAGYQVYQAQDGLEALEQLRQSSTIGLVICDIEMPRMNGFEFLKHWHQDPALATIPVVMLTSRSSEKHRLLAVELGATAYLTKPYLEQELISTVGSLISRSTN